MPGASGNQLGLAVLMCKALEPRTITEFANAVTEASLFNASVG